ncbi:MAG TPA: hypothetical protein DCX25_02330 [Candidatus Pacebacteria bacterium]|nr:MAG: hypothetical protein UX00_C0008G0055 [Microgenomates group bacterium GW2011_GWB1_45_17]KKU23892.1 MAG: hypothetical protein UX35_C0003G0028 [Microgenomates group bacterium GW2011_GWA1_46_15]KKU24715.1 MAG: hypothetical protein UX36_C0001G0332 [Microgenomates group bacterium GW2011_GWC1_46_15]HAV15140.1 hypothetical protein [Candidatus Paceibacterota bacterium]HCR11579.1 hypothetical protein [Candidatus Paceibacterota bacterium]
MRLWKISSFVAFIAYAGVSIVFLFPILRHPFSTLFDPYDGLFITWTMDWVIRAFTTVPTLLFHAPIFSPYRYALTFSDPMFTGALLALPFVLLTHQPIIASTINLFLATMFTAWFSFLFLNIHLGDAKAAFLGGLYAGFSVTHLHYLGHLHTYMVQFIPLGMYAWMRFAREEKLRWLILLAVCFFAQVINSPFTGYVFIGVLSIFLFEKKSRSMMKKYWKKIGVIAFVTLGITALIYLPYIYSAKLYNSYRTIRDAAHFSLSIDELFDKQRISMLAVVIFLWSAHIFIGKKRWKDSFLCGTIIVACAGMVLALGPALKFQTKTVKIPFPISFPIPLPYAVLYEIAPGFRAFRTPSRWLVLTHFSLAILLAYMTHGMSRRRWIMLAVVLSATFYLESQQLRHTGRFSPTPPPVYTWLQQMRYTSVAHVPTYLYTMGSFGQKEVERMVYSLDGVPGYALYNGYSGFAPRERVDMYGKIFTEFPSEETIRELQRSGVQAVVLHLDEMKPDAVDRAEKLTLPVVYRDAITKVLEIQ